MDDDAELAAIRRRLMADILAQTARPLVPEGIVETDDDALPGLIAAHEAVVVDCWADWCGPCKTMAPRFRVASEHLAGRAVFAKLDVDKNPKTSARFAVQSIPTMLLFQGGRLVDRIVGVVPEAELERRVARLLPSPA